VTNSTASGDAGHLACHGVPWPATRITLLVTERVMLLVTERVMLLVTDLCVAGHDTPSHD
jgi:hypothetical protein